MNGYMQIDGAEAPKDYKVAPPMWDTIQKLCQTFDMQAERMAKVEAELRDVHTDVSRLAQAVARFARVMDDIIGEGTGKESGAALVEEKAGDGDPLQGEFDFDWDEEDGE